MASDTPENAINLQTTKDQATRGASELERPLKRVKRELWEQREQHPISPNNKSNFISDTTEAEASTLTKRSRLWSSDPPLLNSTVENTGGAARWKKIDRIRYWCENRRWPKEHFETPPKQIRDMSYPPARKKPRISPRRKISKSSLPSSSSPHSNQKSREAKSARYRSAAYESALAVRGSFMRKSNLGITEKSKIACEYLLEGNQSLPEHTLFRDDTFDNFCQRLQGKNESRIIKYIGQLIVPSAENLAMDGAKSLDNLVESVNERWGASIAFYGSLPQPDYAVGFDWSAFTKEQLKNLNPILDYNPDAYCSFFLATFYMCFPFLTCEIKGATALDVADRQNAHSMTLAVRGVVELFRFVGRHDEISREILAFAVSHDHSSVRIYGHYPIIDGEKTLYHRHPIHMFNIIARDGRDKWTAYAFIKNLYEKWAPVHLERICSAIDMIPPRQSFSISSPRNLSVSQSNVPSLSDDGNQVELVESAGVTASTSLSRQ